ncbi:UbiX family flavin prenyltransferase [Agathobacter sp.]|jgi:4-hydroxy-3-polyprenylbenzoate decarboxylase|uniref:UbiX family flavin prenyltransferase n=1 Tax=Agathobacter sp. TaxID=2021311 RepID=UPI003992CAAA
MEGVYLKYHMKRILVGISGASGAPIAIRLLKRLKENQDVETHLIMSDSACLTIEQETEYSVQQVQSLADVVYDIKKIGARPASGSFQIDEMIIVPCSMKTVAGIAGGYSDNLLLRSADVMLKEGRPLFLVARESPLSMIHLRNLHELSMMGVRIIPPMVSYYQGYKTIEEWTNNFVERLLDKMEIQNNVKAWDGM